MNRKRLQAAGFAYLGALLQAGCSQPLDLCAAAAGSCLTVQVSASSTDPVDLLRALYTVGAAGQKETLFAGPAGGTPLPAGFELTLPTSGAVNLQVIAELNLRPTLYGSAQLTLAANEHQQVAITLGPDLSRLPYTGPAPRYHAGMVYFPPRQAVVLFGGIGSDGTYLGDTWELDLSSGAWIAHSAPALGQAPDPAARAATLAYDPLQQRVILAGGTGADGLAVQDLWSYDANGTWTQFSPANHGGGNRTDAGLTVTDNGIVIVAGGRDSAGMPLGDVVTYDPTNVLLNGPDFVNHVLTPLLPVPPRIKSPKLVSTSMPMMGEVYLVGADENTPGSSLGVWQLSGSFTASASRLTVTPVAAADPFAPSRRTDFTVTTDSAAGLFYLFGGTDAATGQPLQDAYVFSLVNQQWARVTTTATPTARTGAQLALLPPAVLLLGGLSPAGSTQAIAPIALDTWKLTISPFTAAMLPGVFARHP